MAETAVKEVRPPTLDSTSEPPPLFDGTTRLYISYVCPYAQRAWITRNYKGLHNVITLVPIDLDNKPAWYKEKVFAANQHNGKDIGDSLDLIKYIDKNFEGPALSSLNDSQDSGKKKFAEELIAYSGTFLKNMYTSFKIDPVKQAATEFDYLEIALHKFVDGPFFLGQISHVDIAFIPFVERFQLFIHDVWKYDITAGRPNLAAWIEEINKIDAYKSTKRDPELIVADCKRRFLA